MAKQRISADELVWVFREELSKTGKFPAGISVAIVRDRAANLTAITGARYRAMSPDLAGVSLKCRDGFARFTN